MTEEIFQFGVFEVHARTGELRKGGVKLKLQEQPFQVLLLLVSNPGGLVTREELRLKLWAEDTFVDYDHSLNTAINKLREVLSDSATTPRYIETLARRGYRFVAPVTRLGTSPSSAGSSAVQEMAGGPAPSEQVTPSANREPNMAVSAVVMPDSLLTDAEEVPIVPRGIARTFFLLIQVMYLAFYVAVLSNLGEVESLIHAVVKPAQWLIALVIVTASVGIPIRLYLLSSVSFDYLGLRLKFEKIFLVMFLLDELWAVPHFWSYITLDSACLWPRLRLCCICLFRSAHYSLWDMGSMQGQEEQLRLPSPIGSGAESNWERVSKKADVFFLPRDFYVGSLVSLPNPLGNDGRSSPWFGLGQFKCDLRLVLSRCA